MNKDILYNIVSGVLIALILFTFGFGKNTSAKQIILIALGATAYLMIINLIKNRT